MSWPASQIFLTSGKTLVYERPKPRTSIFKKYFQWNAKFTTPTMTSPSQCRIDLNMIYFPYCSVKQLWHIKLHYLVTWKWQQSEFWRIIGLFHWLSEYFPLHVCPYCFLLLKVFTYMPFKAQWTTKSVISPFNSQLLGSLWIRCWFAAASPC